LYDLINALIIVTIIAANARRYYTIITLPGPI